jgi:hypothetical protein
MSTYSVPSKKEITVPTDCFLLKEVRILSISHWMEHLPDGTGLHEDTTFVGAVQQKLLDGTGEDFEGF